MKAGLVGIVLGITIGIPAIACTGEAGQPALSGSPEATAYPSPTLSATQPEAPTEFLPAVPPEPAFGLWLVDVATRDRVSLAEGSSYPLTRGFSDDGELVWAWDRAAAQWVAYGLDGRETERTTRFPPETDAPQCEQSDRTQQRALIEGREYPVNCGLFSPNGRFMLYQVNVDSPGDPGGVYEAWTLDLSSGSTQLATNALRHCGGCDSRPSPSWSHSGRYVLMPETFAGPGSTTYLHDTQTGVTRPVAVSDGAAVDPTDVDWSPSEDIYLAVDEAGVFIEDLSEGGHLRLPDLRWPARFDQTGRLAYSPVSGIRTVIANAQTGDLVASWDGAPSAWPIERGVSWTPAGPAALLERASDRSGTTLHHPSVTSSLCIVDAQGAAFAPDASQVVFARTDGSGEWLVAVLDVRLGRETVLASYQVESHRQPPLIRWSPDGRRILVLWPGPDGI